MVEKEQEKDFNFQKDNLTKFFIYLSKIQIKIKKSVSFQLGGFLNAI